MKILKTIAYKWRYNPLPRLFLNGLKRLGVTILPYYLFNRVLADTRQSLQPGELYLRQLQHCDIAQMASMEMVHADAQEFAARLQRGHRCFGLFEGNTLLAFNWLDLSSCSFRNDNFPLRSDEAYAYDMFTLHNRRGQNLAFLLIGLVSRQLESEGIRSQLSVVDYFNYPSLRVAAKIGCVAQRINLYIGLFGVWEWNVCLRHLTSRESLGDATGT